MVGRAAAKARRAGAAVELIATAGEALPFPAASFDVVTLSLVLHQLPLDALHATMGQVRRVLAPGGRLLLVDLDLSNPTGNTVHAHAARGAGSHDHGGRTDQRFDLDRVGLLVEHLGLTIVERGPIAFRFRGLEPLRYLLAETPPA
jgi:SAM-dependent methyltransferase